MSHKLKLGLQLRQVPVARHCNCNRGRVGCTSNHCRCEQQHDQEAGLHADLQIEVECVKDSCESYMQSLKERKRPEDREEAQLPPALSA